MSARRMITGFGGMLALCAWCGSAQAQLTIDATFNSTFDATQFGAGTTTISSLSNASTVEAAINQAITNVSSLIQTPLTLNINFLDMTSGLGASLDTGHIDLPYATYLTDLQNRTNPSAVALTALASMPAGPNTGINGNTNQISIGGALLSAIGDTTDGSSLIAQNSGFAGTVALNMSALNGQAALESTIEHEIDEVLGIGGQGSTLGATPANDIGPLDLFRYSASGVRSYSTSANVSSYFSINGGKTKLVAFNQASGGDYADWGDGVTPADGQGNDPAQVQDAFGPVDVAANMGSNEAIALDAVGWQLSAKGTALEGGASPVPLPAGVWLLVSGLGGLGLLGRRRRLA